MSSFFIASKIYDFACYDAENIFIEEESREALEGRREEKFSLIILGFCLQTKGRNCSGKIRKLGTKLNLEDPSWAENLLIWWFSNTRDSMRA